MPAGSTPDPDVKALSLAALTVWTEKKSNVYAGEDVRPGTPAAETIRGHAQQRAPIWLDLDLATEVDAWVEPWEPWHEKPRYWRGLSDVAEVLDLGLPTGVTDARDKHGGLALLLRRLPFANEFGVLRSLQEDWYGDGAPKMAMPLAGFIPASPELEPVDGRTSNQLEFVLLRVNLAVVENGGLLIPIRLTDRLCSGGREGCPGPRIRARDYYHKLPDLTVFQHFLPPNRTPTAMDLGEALAMYLAGTCGSVSEHARQRLRRVERDLGTLNPIDAGAADGPIEQAVLVHNKELLRIRGTLETVEEELLRLLQRLSDVRTNDPTLLRVRERYVDGLTELRSVETELRWAADVVRDRLTTLQLQQAREAEQRDRKRQQKLDGVIAVLGTAVVIAAPRAKPLRRPRQAPSPDQVVVGLRRDGMHHAWRRVGGLLSATRGVERDGRFKG